MRLRLNIIIGLGECSYQIDLHKSTSGILLIINALGPDADSKPTYVIEDSAEPVCHQHRLAQCLCESADTLSTAILPDSEDSTVQFDY